MLVFNHFKNDARVLKEANTLIKNGYKVKVFALHEDGLNKKETIDGLEIERIALNPIHLRLFNKQKKNSTKEISNKTESTDSINSNSKKENPTKNKVERNHSKAYKFFYDIFKWMLLAVHKPLTYLDFNRRVFKRIKQQKFDVFHAHDLNTLLPAYKGAKYHSSKLIYDSHELYIERNKPKKPTKVYKFISSIFESYLIKKTDVVITVGQCIADYLTEKYKLDNSKVKVIMNAPSKVKITHTTKTFREIFNISPNFKVAVYSGSITFNRGLENLIKALQFLPNVYLVFLGYGKKEYIESLKNIAIENKVDHKFSVYGPVKPHEVTAYTATADLGIAPIQNVCLSYYYCAPNKVFEYLIGGIPVIGSNFPELIKIIEGNNIGYTFNPEKIESIVEAINKIFENDANYKSLKENAVKTAEKYNWEIESQKLLNVYKNILN
jgi:glycosyltransferase involved in cell wall biosynthesis